MKTEIITPESLERAISLLKKGQIAAFPTETVYGLGANAFDAAAVEKIFAAKGRPADNPVIAHVDSIAQAESLSEELPELFYTLAERFWPGPLALIVPRGSNVPSIVSAGHPTIAIRMPVHPVALKIIAGVGAPLAAPSANLSGRPSPTSALDVYDDLNGKIPLIVDGGECSIGIESTVLSLVSERPLLLRPGQIGIDELEDAMKLKISLPEKGAPNHSPGMKYRHYAPKAKVRLVRDRSELSGFCTVERLTSRNLYKELRRADRMGADEIAIYLSPEVLSNPGLMNRLLRASGQL